jgi:hypothetical protein
LQEIIATGAEASEGWDRGPAALAAICCA